MNPYVSLHVATAPYYREARVTFARRQTACRMRHCCARRIVETGGRRKLLRTSTRSAERQRIIGAEASRLAAPNAAPPRYGQCNRQALHLFELLACNGGVKGQSPLRSLGGQRGIFSHVREYPPYPVQRLRRCCPRGAEHRKILSALTFFEGQITFEHQARRDGVDRLLALLGALAVIE